MTLTATLFRRYSKLYIVFDEEFTVDSDVSSALSTQFLFQLGFLLILPIPLLLSVEQVGEKSHDTPIRSKKTPVRILNSKG